MKTQIINSTDQQGLKIAGQIIKNGGLVAMPTETVYGLGADATNPIAVKNIFKAKGRPSDNPLIVHIANAKDASRYAKDIPELFYKLTDCFSPGPLTIILKKADCIPMETSGGLETVGIRIPANETARKIIELSGTAIAAPSANLSGSPSPTNAKRCIDDLFGRVDAIVDGGECAVGVESTVISLAEEKPILYRPGFVTFEEIKEITGELLIHDGVLDKLKDGEKVSSPGLKYKHYSPNCQVVLVDGQSSLYCDFVNKKSKENPGVLAMCFVEDEKGLSCPHISYGYESNELSLAQGVFEALRQTDEKGARLVYAHCPKSEGISLAVYNRLLRAAGFQVIKL